MNPSDQTNRGSSAASPAVATFGNASHLFLLASLWGSGYLFVDIAVETLPPITATAGRLLFAFLTLGAVMAARRERLPGGWRLWSRYVIVGLIGYTLPFFLMSWGQVRVDSGLAAILTGPVPIFTLLLACTVTRDERLTPIKATGTIIGFAGIVLLVGPAALEGLGSYVWGQLALVGAAVSWGITNILSRLLAGIPPATNGTAAMLVAVLAILPAMIVIDRPWTIEPEPGAILATLALGVVSSGLAALVFFRLIARTSATFTSLAGYLVPPIGVFLGATALGERVSWEEVAALGLILAGVALASRGRR